jgi:glutamine synthetase
MTNERKKGMLTDVKKWLNHTDKVKPYFEVIRDHCDKLEL